MSGLFCTHFYSNRMINKEKTFAIATNVFLYYYLFEVLTGPKVNHLLTDAKDTAISYCENYTKDMLCS